MSRTRLIMVACFCAAFAAGVVAGVAGRRFAARAHRRSWLEQELGLNPEQREQMRQIWSGVVSASWQQQRERRETLQKERDEAIAALLNKEQKARYEEVMQTYTRKTAALETERRKAFDEAMERTRKILTESQRKKYDGLLKQRAGPYQRHGGPRGGPRDVSGAAPPHGGE